MVVVVTELISLATFMPEPLTVIGVNVPAVVTLMLTIKSNWVAVPTVGAGLSCVLLQSIVPTAVLVGGNRDPPTPGLGLQSAKSSLAIGTGKTLSRGVELRASTLILPVPLQANNSPVKYPRLDFDIIRNKEHD